MKVRSKESRNAIEILDSMIFAGLCFTTRRKEVGALTKMLSKEKREALKHLSSEDIQDRIF